MNDAVAIALESHDIATLADAEHALNVIAVAEAAETVWARAKDPTKLMAAIKAKLHNQATYAVWRQDAAVPGHQISRGYDISIPATDPGKDVIARWRGRLCKKIGINKWRIDEDRLRAALDDAQLRCVRICEQQNMGTIRGTEGTGEFERYTPAEYIEKARTVMGGIDLDPASCALAQETVQATRHFTIEDDGLAQEWFGRVWLNPPYHRDLAPRFIAKLIAEHEAQRIEQAVVLTNNSTDTAWFQSAAMMCNAICFTEGRIHFEVPNGDPVSPTQGQAFFYFGADYRRFVSIFEDVGICMGLAS